MMAAPCVYSGGNSPWPTLMPPPSVPALFVTRLLAIWRSWPQPCTKMAPPPCELSVIVRPSIDDGLQWKLLGYGLWAVLAVGPQPCGVENGALGGVLPVLLFS